MFLFIASNMLFKHTPVTPDLRSGCEGSMLSFRILRDRGILLSSPTTCLGDPKRITSDSSHHIRS